MSQPGTRPKARTPQKKPTPAPVWRRLVFLGIGAVVLQFGLRAMPEQGVVSRLGDWAAAHAVYFWLAAGVLITTGILVRLVTGDGDNAETDINEDGAQTLDGAVRVAVATELKIHPSLVGVRLRHTLVPRPHPNRRMRLRREIVRARLTLPRGRITEDPGAALSKRLTPLLGQLRKAGWHPAKGRCVLEAGAPDAADDVPAAASDPRKRAEQVLEPVVGSNLAATVTSHDATGAAEEIQVRHPTNFKLNADKELALQQRIDERMPSIGNRGWGVQILSETDTIRLFQRPAMPDKILHPVIDDYPGLFADTDRCGADPELYGPEPRMLPCATDEKGRICGWNISRRTQKPHALLVGPTGGGKTNTITTMVVGASRQGAVNNDIAIWGLDPKMIELMGLQGFPGVTHLAFRVAHMADTIDAAYDEMMHRYDLIAEYRIHPDELPPLVIILDEYLILVSMLTYWWKHEKGGKGACPHINKLTQMLALSRSSAIYLLLGVQRPDASLFTEGARDNLRFRGALGELSPQGAEMMWNNQSIGTRPTNVRGRGVITGPDGWPIEAQYWFTPAIDSHPMYRDRLSTEDRTRVEELTPTMYTPRSITKDDLWLPPSAEKAERDGVESEFQDVSDVVRARDLDVGDEIKLEDASGRMSRAVVTVADYDEDASNMAVSIDWSGGSAEDMDLPASEEVWYVGNANTTPDN